MVLAAVAVTPLSVLAAVGSPSAQAQPARTSSVASPHVNAGNTTPGTIEVCKSSKNGMAGSTFLFDVSGLQSTSNPISVTGGTCSAPLTVASGHQTITEEATGLPAGDTVSNITVAPKTDHVSKNLANRTATINVRSGSTSNNETVVTFTNKVLLAQIKICKVAGDQSLLNQPFTFTENSGAPFSVIAGSASNPGCSSLRKFKVGTVVNVAEQPTPNTVVSSIDVNPASEGSNVNTANGTVTVTLQPGVTVVTYTNTVPPPPSNGLLEVCKQASDQYVTGTFTFTITDSTGFSQTTQPIGVNQCTPALTVAAGNVTVTETPQAPYFVGDIYTTPSQDLVSQNDANGSAVVSVVKSTTSETQVFFVNDTRTSTVKICKTLTPNSSALAGTTFWFDISSADGSSTEGIVAGAAGTTVCQLVTDQFGDIENLPVGSTVQISEESQPFVLNTSVVVTPSSQDNGSAPPTANLTVGAGIVTQATFTNQAQGQIELCKAVTAYAPTKESFSMTITDNGVSITKSVAANSCTQPITVPAGTATVTETELPNFVLQGISVSGSGSEVSSSGTSVTVTVPFSGDTTVQFTNTVATGQFKVCKADTDPILNGIPFTFAWSYTANGNPVTGSANVVPGACSLVQGNIPVIDQNGNPTQITVTEAPTLFSFVASISVSNGSVVSSSTTAGTVVFTLLPNPTNGTTSTTFTNSPNPIMP